MANRTCSIPDCDRPSRARGMCERHYYNRTHYGHAVPLKERPDDERFNSNIDRSDQSGCWVWTGGKSRGGYGVFNLGARGRKTLAHRWAYERYVGPIPPGQLVRHHCDNPPCVNPAHLTTGTHKDNADDRTERLRLPVYHRTHCQRGHDLSLPGAVMPGTVAGCRECDRARKDRWRRANRRR